MRRSTIGLSALVAALALGCGGYKTVQPTGGDLTVSYSSALTNDGALLLVVSGGTIQDVTAIGAYKVAFATVAGVTRVVVTGDLSAGDLVHLKVPDISLAASYTARVDAAANRTTFGLNEPTLYAATVRK